MMKAKGLTNHKKPEWESLLNKNPIYMGDHLTRQWSRSGRDAPPGKREILGRNNNVQCSGSHQSLENEQSIDIAQNTTVIPPSRSQYSVRKILNGKRKLKSGKEILLHHNITKADMMEWQESFDSLLHSPAGRYVFKLFLESEIADENLKFWLACEDLKNSKSKRLKHRVQEIYNTYIDVYSPHEINIDYKMREDIVDQLKYKKDVSVFTETQHQVYTLMHRDSYPRFLASQFAAELTNALTERQEQETKSSKKSKGDSLSKSPPRIISCCYYCRYHDSDADADELVEEQATVSTPVITAVLPNDSLKKQKDTSEDVEKLNCTKADSITKSSSLFAPPVSHQIESSLPEPIPSSKSDSVVVMKESSSHVACSTITSEAVTHIPEHFVSNTVKNTLKNEKGAEMTAEV